LTPEYEELKQVSIYARLSKVNVVVVKPDGLLFFFHNFPLPNFHMIYLLVVKVRNQLRFNELLDKDEKTNN
jgi:hypothetical protein